MGVSEPSGRGGGGQDGDRQHARLRGELQQLLQLQPVHPAVSAGRPLQLPLGAGLARAGGPAGVSRGGGLSQPAVLGAGAGPAAAPDHHPGLPSPQQPAHQHEDQGQDLWILLHRSLTL